MIADSVALKDKVEQLDMLISAQKQQYETILAKQEEILAITQKLNWLADEQLRRQNELEELKRDLIPIANQFVKLSIDELADIGSDFKLDDLLFLFKRLLRDTNLLINLLDRLEATVELVDESQRITKQVFSKAVNELDRLERMGYFRFAQEGWKIFEKIVTEFSEEDIRALGENIVTILTTIKNLTQPEIMTLTNKALSAVIYDPQPMEDPSLVSLLKDLSNPKVRRGLSRMINLLKVIADQPNSNK